MGIIRYAMRGTMIDWGKVTVIQDGKKVEVPESTSANVQKGEGIQSILVEHCFIQGADYKYLSTDDAIKKLAIADGKAIVEHYGLKLKEVPKNKNIKMDDENKIITIAPAQTIEDLNTFLGKKDYSIVDSDGNSTDKLATGSKLTIDSKTYRIIKMGDVDGDGKLKAADALKVLKHSMGTITLEDVFLKAADTIADGKIKANDALNILKYSMGVVEINL